MQLSCRLNAVLAIPFFAIAAQAETPLGGAVYNMERNERIHYSCTNTSETDLNCRFTRATVSQVLPADKIAERRAEEMKQLDVPGAIEEFAAGTCEAVTRLDAEIAAGNMGDMEYMPEADRTRMLETFRAICDKKDRASVEAFIDYGLDAESRVCMVSTFGWTGTFSKSDEKTWLRTDKEDPVSDGCGGVYLDRFELSETGSFWNLIRRDLASNPNGTFTTGEKCTEIYSGEEVTYKWQGGDLPARCDYIRLNLGN